ncbi:MAG: hypothetical protein WCJ62_11490 [Flavobacterium sp.]
MEKSTYKKLNLKDLTRGFFMTSGTTLLGLLSTTVTNGVFPQLIDFMNMGKVGLLSGAVYLGKNYFTNSKDEFLKSE